MRRATIAALVMIVALSAPAAGQEASGSGNWLLKLCTDGAATETQAAYDRGACHGFVIGSGFSIIIEGPEQEACLRGTKYMQWVDTVVQYLQRYPHLRHQAAFFLARDALITGFGCPQP
jgi:hypothetical protein